jgi:hypothetical protein
MYIKLNNNQIEQYPYSIDKLKQDNAGTSFPDVIAETLLNEFNVYKVKATTPPEHNFAKNISEDTPVNINGEWTQTWKVEDKPLEEVEKLKENFRAAAYQEESDPLFFKWQRGEATQQEWLDKVAEIKSRW